jgi:hypothetical protein
VDIWNTTAPAFGFNSSGKSGQKTGPPAQYEEHKLQSAALKIIADHPAARPLFLSYNFHTCHAPLQAPQDIYNHFSFISDNDNRRVYQSMVSVMDSVSRIASRSPPDHTWPLYVSPPDHPWPLRIWP